MKIVYIADLHLRPTAPINRKDDYVEAQFKKLEFLISTANRHQAPLLVGGDIFDRASNHPTWFISRVFESLLRLDGDFIAIPGNHDLVGHSLSSLSSNTVALIDYLQQATIVSATLHLDYRGIVLALVPYGSSAPSPLRHTRCNNILVVHEPVFEDTVPFYMPDALTVEQLERKYPGYDLYLAGDIHIPCQKSKTLVSGSMMRMTTAQKDHKPRFYVIDTETLEVEAVFFPIEEDVWKLEDDVGQSEKFKEELKELATAMEDRDASLDYPTVLQTLGAEHWQTFDELINEYKTKKGE